MEIVSKVYGQAFVGENSVCTAAEAIQSGSSDSTLVLIAAYMRSGSTFISQLINENPNGFFVFEPLHDINFASAHALIKYLNGSYVRQPTMSNRYSVGLEVLESLFRCKVQDLFQTVLAGDFMKSGKKTRQYIDCGGVKNGSCLPLLKGLCQQSSLRGIKTISLRLYDVRSLLDNLPNLKVLHQVRDPRAILHSRKRINRISMYDGIILCKQMEADVITYDLFTQLYPGRVKQVLYEDMAEEPMLWATQIYEFFNIKMHTEVREWLQKSTSGQGVGSEQYFGTWIKKNSQVTASQWRKTIPWSWSTYMDTHCKKLYSLLGYLPSQLINMSHPSRITKH